jgi:histidinol-phosphate/aromatic aminotransferase/cobyric acid decarboxylase-like protein
LASGSLVGSIYGIRACGKKCRSSQTTFSDDSAWLTIIINPNSPTGDYIRSPLFSLMKALFPG